MVITGWKTIAATLGVSVRTACRLRTTAGLPAFNLTPRMVVVTREGLSAWLAERGRTTSAEAVRG